MQGSDPNADLRLAETDDTDLPPGRPDDQD